MVTDGAATVLHEADRTLHPSPRLCYGDFFVYHPNVRQALFLTRCWQPIYCRGVGYPIVIVPCNGFVCWPQPANRT